MITENQSDAGKETGSRQGVGRRLSVVSRPKPASLSIDGFLNAKVDFVEDLVQAKASLFNT